MVDFQRISVKRILILRNQIPAAVVLFQSPRAADPVIAPLRANTLSASDRMSIGDGSNVIQLSK